MTRWVDQREQSNTTHKSRFWLWLGECGLVLYHRFVQCMTNYVCRDSTIFSKSQIPNLLDVSGAIFDLFYAESNTTITDLFFDQLLSGEMGNNLHCISLFFLWPSATFFKCYFDRSSLEEEIWIFRWSLSSLTQGCYFIYLYSFLLKRIKWFHFYSRDNSNLWLRF